MKPNLKEPYMRDVVEKWLDVYDTFVYYSVSHNQCFVFYKKGESEMWAIT